MSRMHKHFGSECHQRLDRQCSDTPGSDDTDGHCADLSSTQSCNPKIPSGNHCLAAPHVAQCIEQKHQRMLADRIG